MKNICNAKGGSTGEWLNNQIDIIRILSYDPEEFVCYIHSRKEEDIIFDFGCLGKIEKRVPLIENNVDCKKMKEFGGQLNKIESTNKKSTPYVARFNDGNFLFVKETEGIKLFCEYYEYPPTDIALIKNNIAFVKQSVGTYIENISYIASDTFTNETLIAYVLNYSFNYYYNKNIQLPKLFLVHKTGLVCENNKTALNITEYCDLGPLDSLNMNCRLDNFFVEKTINDNGMKFTVKIIKENVLYDILVQTTVAIHMLQNIVSFTHGDMKAGNIFLKTSNLEFNYQGIKHKSNFACKIGDYGTSSCTLYKNGTQAIRFFNKNNIADNFLKLKPFNPELYESNGELFYLFSQFIPEETFVYLRHMGVPYYKYFDYYTFIISFLSNPSIYYTFFSSEKLTKIFWDPLWNKNMYSNSQGVFCDNASTICMSRIRNYVIQNKGKSIKDALNILDGLYLKLDPLSLILSNIKNS